jgi:hypothetical protein
MSLCFSLRLIQINVGWARAEPFAHRGEFVVTGMMGTLRFAHLTSVTSYNTPKENSHRLTLLVSWRFVSSIAELGSKAWITS